VSLHPDFVNELAKRFTGEIRLDFASRILYSTDASMYQIEPLGVAFPKTQDDLQAAMEFCAKYKVPILPRGAGTSLGGQAIGEALILDCSRWLDRIIEIAPESRSAIVEPGVVLSDLNRASAKYGLMFGPDPASAERATMGGVIANNATGAHSILYGMSADHLISADVVMADGSLARWGVIGDQLSVNSDQLSVNSDQLSVNSDQLSVGGNQLAVVAAVKAIRERYAEAIKQNFPKSWRNSAGYRLNYLLPWTPSAPPRWQGAPGRPSIYEFRNADYALNLAPLLAGSEGTLAIMRRAKVNLVPKPKHTILGVLAYDDIPRACDDVPRLLEFGPSAIELIPQMIIRLARGVPEYARQMGWMPGDPAAALVIEFSGDSPEVLKEAVKRIGDALVVAESAEEQARVWNVRKMGLGILDSRPQSARPAAFIEDCAIPVESLGEFIREIEKILEAHHTEGGIYAHASAGCLHIRPILDLRTGEGRRALRSIAEQTFALTLRLGGSMSSEHGDGIVSGEWIEKTYGADVTEAMRMLKRAADPHNLLNPNKMFDAPPMDTHLRYGNDFQVKPWEPALDFSRNGGLATAIEQCNGQGVCRKVDGVMCPSFQATREEMYSTRGRANLLRAFIRQSPLRISHYELGNANSALRGDELTDAVAQALDLCLACKGCKAECPSGVDMAKLKFAFEAEYYKSRRRPLRDYAFGYFHVTAAMLSSIAPIANLVSRIPAIKTVLARVLGITSNRPFPKFAKRRAKGSAGKIGGSNGRIIFLSDPYGRYVEPHVEQAAFDILSALGFDVLSLPVVGSGAALLSKGFVHAARRHAEKVLDALRKLDPDNLMPVVGIEPPDIYTLKHDYLDLLPGRAEEVSRRVENVWLLEEFLIRSAQFQALRVAITGQPFSPSEQQNQRKIKFHPHCHQRAEGISPDGKPIGVSATLEVLRACGYDVELTDAGCCGMAGTFGYETEHYELSQRIGELKLFPLIRESRDGKSEIQFVSTGAACRMQIEQGTGVKAIHPLELAAKALRLSSV
jgi:FAD/FMN-containing dehydrogenase/Fe-S oxidoreductase